MTDPIDVPHWAPTPNWAEHDLSPAAASRARWADRAQSLRPEASAVGRANQVAIAQGFVLTVAQARAAGISRAQARSLLRRRVWCAPWYGTLAVLDVAGRDRVGLVAAGAALQRAGSVISHDSAAVVHGLPVRNTPPTATLTIDPSGSDGMTSVKVNLAGLDVSERAAWYGAPVTSVARTVIDLSRRDRGAGLMAADAALRERLTSPEALRATAAGCAGWTGNLAGRWVADHANPLAESPLESLTRECLLAGGLPEPQLQAVVHGPDGFYARVDMLWRDQAVIVEIDGRMKYSDDGRSLWREKRRQEQLERLGFRVVRVTWRDLYSEPEQTIARVWAALRGHRPPASR